MAAPEDAPGDRVPTNVEKLADFLDRALTEQGDQLAEGIAGDGTNDREALLGLAERVLTEFFRTDVDAQSIFATPGVDARTLEPFAMVLWGPMAGRLSPLELRSIGSAFLETAETAEVESSFVRWLMREDGSNVDGAVKILQSFRQFRASLDNADVPA